jgi:hypothetical protein
MSEEEDNDGVAEPDAPSTKRIHSETTPLFLQSC